MAIRLTKTFQRVSLLCSKTTKQSISLYKSNRMYYPSLKLYTQSKSFMSTASIFYEPSFPRVPKDVDNEENMNGWLKNYPQTEVSDLWSLGIYPVKNITTTNSSIEEEEVWDLSGMLSTLTDSQILRDASAMEGMDKYHSVEEILENLENTQHIEYLADSVLKKRRKKMNKHKHRKRRKALRMRTKAT